MDLGTRVHVSSDIYSHDIIMKKYQDTLVFSIKTEIGWSLMDTFRFGIVDDVLRKQYRYD